MIKRLTYFISVLMLPSITLAYFASFTTPMTGSSYNVGQTVTIEWTSDIPGNYGSISLYQNGTTVQTINSNFYFYYGTQSYSWTIPSSVPIDSDYQIKLIVPSVGGFYSSTFSINSAGSGTSGHSLSFDGSNDYISIPNLDLSAGNNITISAWIKPDAGSLSSHRTMIRTGIGNPIWLLQFDPNGPKLVSGLKTTSGYDELGVNITNTDYTAGWHQIVMTYDGTTKTLFKDGINIGSNTSNSGNLSYNSSAVHSIGGHTNHVEYFDGAIDEVAIWDDALTEMEVAALYNSGNPLTASNNSGYYTSSSNLKGYWQLNEGSGTYTTDGSGNGNSGTISGANWSTDIPGSSTTSSSGGDDDGSIELLTGSSESGVSGNEQGYPLNSYYHDVKHQSLYWASDLADAGILSGSSITGIKLKVNQTPGMNLDNVRIAYSWTSNTQLSTFDMTTTVVHGPTNYYAGDFLPNNWVQFNFSTPLAWDGVSNLIIEYSHDNNAYVSGGGAYMRQVGPNRGIRGWTDSGAGNYPFTSNNMTTAMDQKVASIRLFVDQASVQPPSSLTATPLYQQVNLSWTASSSDSIANYLIYRGASSGGLAIIDSVASTATSYSDLNLTNGTTYYYGLKTKQSNGDLSNMSTPVSATPGLETPVGLTATIGHQQVALSWTSPSGTGIDSVYIYKGTLSSYQTLSTVIVGTDTSHTVTGLTNNTLYYFSIKYKGVDGSFGSVSGNVSATPSYNGPVWYMSTNGSDSYDGSVNTPFSTLAYAVGKANSGDTVSIAAGTYYGYNEGNRFVDPNGKQLVIMGAGADSTGFNLQQNGHLFALDDDSYLAASGYGFVIQDMKITNGYKWEGGGAILIDNAAGPVLLKNLTLGPNNYSREGGAVKIVNTSVTMENVSIGNNTANTWNNGEVAEGGGIWINNTSSYTVTINNSTIKNNQSTGNGYNAHASAGAIYIYGAGSLDIINSEIVDNWTQVEDYTAHAEGGAIYADGAAQVTLVHSTVVGNQAKNDITQSNGNGGAFWVEANSTALYVLNSIVWGNSATGNTHMIESVVGATAQFNKSGLQESPSSGTGNVIGDPEFVSEDQDNYRLANNSPLLGIGAAANGGLYTGDSKIPDTDKTGTQSRPGSGGGNPDPGAYENNLSVSPVPAAPTWVSPTDSALVTGDAHARLRWTKHPETDISKYRIYYGTSSGSTENYTDVSGRSDTTETLTVLSNNTTYYFRLSAIDSTSYESEKSTELSGTPQYTGVDVFVDANNGNDNTGTGASGSPYSSIQAAIDADGTTSGKRILVKYGTYTKSSSGTTVTFTYNDYNGSQSGSFTVSGNSVTSVNFSHSNQGSFPSSSWSISSNSYSNPQNFNLLAYSPENTTFSLTGGSVEIQNSSGYNQGGSSLYTTEQTSANVVIDLKGKNIVIESVSGSDSTFIDGQGDYPALGLDAEFNSYSGYSNDARFIGFTFKDGPDNEPLIHIAGPGVSSTLSWAPLFQDCRFINSSITNLTGEDHGVIDIEDAEPVFNNCEFRNLSIDPNNSNVGNIKGPIRLAGSQVSAGGGYDSTAFRPQFNNCTIVRNYTHFSSQYYNENTFKGGAVYIGWGALPTFRNCRIDSNEIDTEGGGDNHAWHASGGAVYIDNFLSYSSSPVRFINTSFKGNKIFGENVYGGAISSSHPQLRLENCVVINNKISSGYTNNNNDQYVIAYGGGIAFAPDDYSQSGQDVEKLVIINSTIADNEMVPFIFSNDQLWRQGGYGGAGIYRESTDNHVIMFNSIVYGNTISGGSGYNNRLSLSTNGQHWGDDETAIDYSIIEHGDSTGLGDLDDLNFISTVNPRFSSATNYALSDTSNAIGAGTSSFEGLSAPVYDINNSTRPGSGGGNPDLGAYEHLKAVTPFPATPANVYVSAVGDSFVTIIWDEVDASDLEYYRIYRGTLQTSLSVIDSVSVGVTTYSDSGLTNYTGYWFAVSSITDARSGSGFESAFSIPVPGMPKWMGPLWYVNEDQSSGSNKDGSPALPYREIQDAIDDLDPLSRTDGLTDTILVLPGTYDRSDDKELYFKYTSGTNEGQPKNIVLKSRDGAATTILDGGGSKRLFEIVDGTDTTLHIIGFTITNGGDNDGSGNAIKIEGRSYWDQSSGQNVITPSCVTFKDCIIAENGTVGSTEKPPVIYIYRGTVRFESCVIKDNHVAYPTDNLNAEGGAIWIGEESNVVVNKTKILDNSLTANQEVSGVGIYGSWYHGNRLTVTNSIISGNKAITATNHNTRGAGIVIRGGTATIINSTIVDNELAGTNGHEGGGIYVGSDNSSGNSTKLNLFNSIIYGNTPINNQLNWDTFANVEHFVSYSLIQGTDLDDFEDGVFEANPEFLDSTYALHSRSPAIGAGAVESEDTEGDPIYAPTVDMAGNIRPNPADAILYDGGEAVPDLGAYEHELPVTPYPSAVEDVTATPLHKSVLLQWDYHQDGDINRYISYFSEDSISFTAADTVSGRFTTRSTVTGLNNGQEYWFYVTALDTADYESSESIQAKTEPYFHGPKWYVSYDAGSGSKEGSPEEPMRDIQDGIDAASEGDTVFVLPGTYERSDDLNLEFKNHNDNSPKHIVLMSRGGPDSTIIDCGGDETAFDISHGTDTTLQIIGFNIINGWAPDQNSGAAIKIEGGYFAGQSSPTHSQAVFKNCIIEDNGGYNAAVYIAGGMGIFRDCVVRNNKREYDGNWNILLGSALYVSSQNFGDGGGYNVGILELDRCKVLSNFIDNGSDPMLENSGIGLMVNEGLAFISNSVIADNYFIGSASFSLGTGITIQNGGITLINSTVSGNQGVSGNHGSGLLVNNNWNGLPDWPGEFSRDVIILNSIIADNNPSTNQFYIGNPGTGNDFTDYTEMSNSIFENGSGESWFDPDDGHYDFDPLFADTNYVLSDYSHAIGLGGTSIEDSDGNDITAPSVDINGDPRPNPAVSNPDLGAYEHELASFRRIVYYVDDDNGVDSNDGLSTAAAVKTIAEALNKSANRDTIELAPGTYSGSNNRNLNMGGLTRIIRSASGAASTIIDCENQGSAFVFDTDEPDSVHISGLTIINGNGDNGGAISISGADPVFESIIFRDNSSSGNGGAVYANDSYSNFTNCVFADNHADAGGALYLDGGDVSLKHCTFLANTADDNSGLKNASSGDLKIVNSIYWGNDDISGDVDVSYSNVMGGYDGTGNFNGRPGFTDAENDDLTLLNWSPMIGRGSTANIVSPDVAGRARADSVAPDLGAYESNLNSPADYSSVTWHVATTGTDSAVYGSSASADSPFNTLQWAMNHLLEGDSVIIHPGDHAGSADNGGKSVHIKGNTFAPDEVSILGELEFSGGNNSVNLLRVSNTSGDGINISAGAVSIAYVLVDNSSGKAIALSTAAEAALNNITISGSGYGLYDNSSGSVTMVNSIVWGNTTSIDGNPVVTYSDISGGYTGTGNIDTDPLFVDAANGDFKLDMLSPCIDVGDSSGVYDADSTVMDMGAFPRLRQFLAGTSDDDIRISADTTVIITGDFTVTTDDTMQLDAGAQLYFGPGVTLTVEGSLRANGNSDGVISFRPLNPDSTFGGVVIGSRSALRESDTTYSYLLISGVEAASIPLTLYGSSTLNHVTIAGNGNAVSLSANDGGVLNYSILEGTVTGTVNDTGSFTGSTDQFFDYVGGNFNLLATAAGIDTDSSNTDPDYSYADAGALYHDQSSYPVTSITVHRPAAGDTILVSPDTSATVGLTSTVQLFNTYGRYKTNGVVNWNGSNTFGSFPTDSTNTTDPDGKVSNAYVTNTVSGSHNSFTIAADGVSSTSGFYLIEPGIPDSVWVTEQTELNMAQLDSLTFTANIYDQFSNLVRQGESVTWSVNTVSGSGDGYSLSSTAATTDVSGAVAVTLYTDPTGNSLSVGDQITVMATSGSETHASAVVTIIPSDIYNLILAEQYTAEQLNVSADTAYMDFYTTLIDTFDNPLENVEVFWEVVTGQGTGESLSSNSSNTNATGVATVRLNTNTVADSTYQVRCWVTETSLLNAFGSFDALASAAVNNNYRNTTASAPARISAGLGGIRGITADHNRIISAETARHGPGQFVPININRQPTVNRNLNRNAIYDLDDTTAVVLVWPGVTASVSVSQPDSADTVLLLDEQFSLTLDAYDQFSNLVRDNTPVSWEITPASANVSIVSSDNVTTNGQATINLQVASNAAWDFSFTITATVEGVDAETGTYRIDDVTAPAAVSNMAIDPSVWTATNDFTLTWNNPTEHSGVAGAHYAMVTVNGGYVAGADIQTLNFSIPSGNDAQVVRLWLQDNAGNEDENNAIALIAKWDDMPPDAFDLTFPLNGWYNDTEYRFEWNASSDVMGTTAQGNSDNMHHYVWSINGGSETTISPDSTAYSYPTSLSNGTNNWTVTAYDSAGNATETSNPQTIQVDHTVPTITHNPVLEATENTAVVINAVFTDGESGINTAELYYRRGGETNWQPPVDMITLSTYQIASSYSTSLGMEYYLHAVDVAGNVTDKPEEGFTSVSVTITNGLASTDRWSTGIPNGTSVTNYQLWSFPGNPASSSPVDLLVDDLGDYDNTVWRLFAYGGGGAWTEFESLSKLNNGKSYFIIVKDPGLTINTGQTYTIATNQPFEINLRSGDWTFVGNPFDFTIPLTSLYTTDSTSLAGDQNFYTYDGDWVSASSLQPWKGYIYKNPEASKLYINPGADAAGMLGRQLSDEIILEDNEWLVNVSARNGFGRDRFNEVGVLIDAVDTYDSYDAFEPPLVPGGVSVRINNQDWPEYGDTYTRDIRVPKEDGEYWDLEVLAQDDEHNVYLTFEDLDLIPEELDIFAIDVTLGIAQDLRWRHVYRYAVTNPQEKHNVRFIAGTREFLKNNNAGVELFPDRYALSQNFPNPFNPQTSILLTMQDGATVNLVVYNLLGEEIAVLANNEYRPAGYHNFIWKGLNKDGQRVASGLYFYMARVVSLKGEILISDTHKMVLVK